jgi:cytochrome c peroxidase
MALTLRKVTVVAVSVVAATLLAACGEQGVETRTPGLPEVRVGRRLFRETRFAQQFAERVAGRALDDPLPGGDPAVGEVKTLGAPLAGPYSGQAMSCAACHLADEVESAPAGGTRAHCDFARRSPMPARTDGRRETARNTPALLDAGRVRANPTFLHADGQFLSLEELTTATLTGRNLGWLADEAPVATRHVARIVREDRGTDATARAHGGGSYAQVLAGTARLTPDGATLPEGWRLDVVTASDEQVVEAVARLVAEYVRSLARRGDGSTERAPDSPYDRFLAKNRLPPSPAPGEDDLAYARRLRTDVFALQRPVWVEAGEARYRTHRHPFEFGERELRGLKVFLTEVPASGSLPTSGVSPGGVGACVRCHAPPAFTDFTFHNVGASQTHYDLVHRLGAFSALKVPSLAARTLDPDLLPPTPAHPRARGRFASAPDASDPLLADLGLWNVFANPALPRPQPALRSMLLERLALPSSTPDAELLPHTIGWTKTPPLRNLSHTGPYFHGGHVDTIELAVQHYRSAAISARVGYVRNADPILATIDLQVEDVFDVAAFLRALDEDPR